MESKSCLLITILKIVACIVVLISSTYAKAVYISPAQPALPCLRMYAASASQKPGRGRGFNPNVKGVLVKSHLDEGRASLLNRQSDEGESNG